MTFQILTNVVDDDTNCPGESAFRKIVLISHLWQMLIGITVSVYSYIYKTQYGDRCASTFEQLQVSIAMLVC